MNLGQKLKFWWVFKNFNFFHIFSSRDFGIVSALSWLLYCAIDVMGPSEVVTRRHGWCFKSLTEKNTKVHNLVNLWTVTCVFQKPIYYEIDLVETSIMLGCNNYWGPLHIRLHKNIDKAKTFTASKHHLCQNINHVKTSTTVKHRPYWSKPLT